MSLESCVPAPNRHSWHLAMADAFFPSIPPCSRFFFLYKLVVLRLFGRRTELFCSRNSDESCEAAIGSVGFCRQEVTLLERTLDRLASSNPTTVVPTWKLAVRHGDICNARSHINRYKDVS